MIHSINPQACVQDILSARVTHVNKTVNVFLSWGLESSEKIYIKHTTAGGPWEGIKGRLGLVWSLANTYLLKLRLKDFQ